MISTPVPEKDLMPEKDKELTALEKKLGVKFKNQDVLRQALVHRSYLNEHKNFKLEHNERLEFLGDAVLELSVTDHLFRNYNRPEGEMTNWRSALVNSNNLARIAANIGVDEFLFLSRGEAKDTGRAREYILGNAMEALIGAIYLDCGYEAAEKFVQEHVLIDLPQIIEKQTYVDPKSRLQELSQAELKTTPEYVLIKEEGPDHNKTFVVAVCIQGRECATGRGPSKQIAQLEAAKNALETEAWKEKKK